MSDTACRSCGRTGLRPFLSLGKTPLADVLVSEGRLAEHEDVFPPLEVVFCPDLIAHCEFDTIYHEHFCYFSSTPVDALVRRHGLFLNHVEHFPNLHGGTLRWYVGPTEDVSDTVREHLVAEDVEGLTSFEHYASFGSRVERVRSDLLALLERLKGEGATIAA